MKKRKEKRKKNNNNKKNKKKKKEEEDEYSKCFKHVKEPRAHCGVDTRLWLNDHRSGDKLESLSSDVCFHGAKNFSSQQKSRKLYFLSAKI